MNEKSLKWENCTDIGLSVEDCHVTLVDSLINNQQILQMSLEIPEIVCLLL